MKQEVVGTVKKDKTKRKQHNNHNNWFKIQYTKLISTSHKLIESKF